MKKIKFLLLILFLFMPTIVLAEGIENYYINATILNNGDIEVEEYFNLTGYYNGMDRIVDYKNNSAYEFNPSNEFFGGSTIHNGDGITLEEIRGVAVNSNFDFTNVTGNLFKQTNEAEIGDYGVYKITETSTGESYRIYIPSSENKAFYIKYKLHNMAIVHNDIAELGWNVIGKELSESISNLKVTINIPNNNNTIKVWAHGPLNGESKILANDKVEATIKNLPSYTAVDIRVVFDKEVINASNKITNVNALDKIVRYETALAEEANRKREEIKNAKIKEIENWFSKLDEAPTRNNYDDLMGIILELGDDTLESQYINRLIKYQDKVDEFEYVNFSSLIKASDYTSYLFAKDNPDRVFSQTLRKKMNNELEALREKLLLKELKLEMILIAVSSGFLVISYITLNKNKFGSRKIKNVDPKYIRDLPDNLSPLGVGLLVDKSINKNEISATLLDLIRRKIVTVEKDYKNNYVFRLNFDAKQLSASDKQFVRMIFGFEDTLNMKQMKKINSVYFTKWRDYELNLLKNKDLIEYTEPKDTINGDFLIVGIILTFTIFLSPLGLLLISIYGFKRYRENIHMFYIMIINALLMFGSAINNHLTHISIIFIIISTIIIKKNLSKTPTKIKMELKEKGKVERKRLYAIRNFLNDFSKIDEKEIPEVALWESYLVYATAFGIGDKVLKNMKIKLENQQVDFSSSSVFLDAYAWNTILNSASYLSNSVSAASKPDVHFSSSSGSSDSGSFSSGSGGGGGFSGGSSGGGSFGGGGGGGRF